MTAAPPVVLTVAGSDPSGGAGLQADLKTIHQHGAYGAAVPTLITVQDSLEVGRVELLPADLVREQLSAVLSDLEPAAAKAGALGSPEVARVLGSIMEETRFGWVVDPVWLPSRGAPLSKGDMVAAYRDAVIPYAELVTPNANEAGVAGGDACAEPRRRPKSDRADRRAWRCRGLDQGRSPRGRGPRHRFAATRWEAQRAEGCCVCPWAIPRHRLRALCGHRVTTRFRRGPFRCGRRGQGLAWRGPRPCIRSGEGCQAGESSLASGRETLTRFEVLQTQ